MQENKSAAVPAAKAGSSTVQLLVPIYNEGESVQVLYRHLCSENIAFDSLTFVYDLDTETALPFIGTIAAEDQRVTAIKNTIGPGIMNAMRFAFAQVKDGPVLVLMGDNSDKLSIIPQMLELWRQGATLVCPSRYMKGGKQHGGGLVKSSLSRIAGVSLKLFGFPTADPTNNFKLYDGSWVRQQTLESQGGFELALELSVKAFLQDKLIRELPTEWFDRTLGQSRFRLFKWLPHYLRWYFVALAALLKTAKTRKNGAAGDISRSI